MKTVFPSDYIVWDTETTGLSPKTCKIIEVAVAIVRGGEVVEEWSALLNHDIDIDPKATEIHGITREMCAAEGKPPRQVLERLARNIIDCEAHITHNGTKFDLHFLAEAIQAYTHAPALKELEEAHIDTAALYKADRMGEAKAWRETWPEFFNRILDARVPGLKYNVGVCCEELGIDRTGIVQHRAAGDVRLTNEIYKKLVL